VVPVPAVSPLADAAESVAPVSNDFLAASQALHLFAHKVKISGASSFLFPQRERLANHD